MSYDHGKTIESNSLTSASLYKSKPSNNPVAQFNNQAERIINELNKPRMPENIMIYGARQHNLKNINIMIPRHCFVVVTGVSGSGKSSLAFDTLYAEGQRRYVESLSSYARQFLGQMEKPKVDHITGLTPAIAIEQKSVSKNPRSTVGTVTEVLDYLRVLYANLGQPHCPECGRDVKLQSPLQVAELILSMSGTRVQLLAPVVRRQKGTHAELLKQLQRDGYIRVRIDGKTTDLTSENDLPELQKTKFHSIDIIVDRLKIPEFSEQTEAFRTRLIDSVETTLKAGKGLLAVLRENGEETILSEHNSCPHCDISFPELTSQFFSFNSPSGMCPDCNGLGFKLSVDPDKIIIHPHLSILDGASAWWGNLREKKSGWLHHLKIIAEHYGVDIRKPWNELPQKFRHVMLYGSGSERIKLIHESRSKTATWKGESERPIEGIVNNINRWFRQTKSEGRRRFFMQFMSDQPCSMCNGERLCPEARFTTVGGRRLPEITGMTISDAYSWINELEGKMNDTQLEIAGEVIKELRGRLQFMVNVGLHYLSLDRSAPTLSGGEGQRIRLASQLGSGLSGILYVLDEPSIGLHTRDHRALIKTLIELRDLGNTVLVIEHDAGTMLASDWLIDIGPGAGILGGNIVSAGTPQQVMEDAESLTGRYLSGQIKVAIPNEGRRRKPKEWLTVHGACMHNLKEINARFPAGVLTCVTGVSGSGKSTLVSKTLFPALFRELHGSQIAVGRHEKIEGSGVFNKIINITQSPIGRTPRSNPGTYVKVFDAIRDLYATTPEAKMRGYKAGRFSFNSKGGSCEECRGHGVKRIEMHFLADVWVRCDRCGGRRFNHQTLEIKYKDKSIADVLDMDVQEALEFFKNHPKINRILQTLHDVGLDYIKLGQSALTLSGGEAQRVKLAKELSRIDTGKTLYILDEPTTGLHFADIQRLLDVLHRLTDAGNTVIIIEHNLDVIKTADWIIDLGPEGGDAGGYIVAQGTPEKITQYPGSYTGRFLKQFLG